MKKGLWFISILFIVIIIASCGRKQDTILPKISIELISPANEETEVSTTCSLTWNSTATEARSEDEGYQIDFYKVHVTENQTQYPENPATTTEKRYDLSNLEEKTWYKWQIETVLNNGETFKSEERTFKTTGEEIGAFKLVNSWGVGRWENVPDGFYWMTYEALKKNIQYVYVIDKEYTPTKAIAVFKVQHPYRSDCNISIGVGDKNHPEKRINFSGHKYETFSDGGEHPYPDHQLVLDITELLPIENKNIFLELFDEGDNTQTGVIESFAIEVYDSYDSDLVKTLEAKDLPLNTVNGEKVYSIIENADIPLSNDRALSDSPLNRNASPLTEKDYLKMKTIVGTAIETVDYNTVISGNGTGYRPPTEEEWAYLYNNNLLRKINQYDTNQRNNRVDHSESIHFPPVGSQGSKHSCSSWATAYYIGSFYNAKRYDWDLSEAKWINNSIERDGFYYDNRQPTPEYQDKISSPDFVYLQLNKGENQGTTIFGNLKVMHLIGISSWQKCPTDISNLTQWPSEEAWRDAPKKRLGWMPDWEYKIPNLHPWFYLEVKTDEDIEQMKALIADGYLLTLSIQSACYELLTENDVWNLSNYATTTSNHANTIVGYDDSVK